MKNCFYYKLIFLENIILLINYLYIYFSKRFHCISSIFSKQMLLVRHSSELSHYRTWKENYTTSLHLTLF